MSNVIDFNKKKKSNEQRRGRQPLYISKTGYRNSEDYGDRLTRIKESLDRINKLMAELKKMSQNTDTKNCK